MINHKVITDFKNHKSSASIIIAGDLVETEANSDLFELGDINNLFGINLYNYINQVDLKIFNLEAPITSSCIPLEKAGSPNLKNSPKILNTLSKFDKLLLSCANNHILDYGKKGLEDTIKLLNSSNICFTGIGKKEDNIVKFIFLKEYDIKVGIYAIAENEFSSNKYSDIGANAYDPLKTFDEIYENKQKCDYLIVLYHGGRENYRYPTPNQQKICRKIIESGADLVINQHSHCIGEYELYKEKMILYGQGNFVFQKGNNPLWFYGLLVKIQLSKSNDKIKQNVELIPIERTGSGIKFTDENQVINDLLERTNQITNGDFIREKWNEFSFKQIQYLLLRGLLGRDSKLLYLLDKHIFKNKITLHLLKKNRALLMLNYLRCESINESIQTLLDSIKNN